MKEEPILDIAVSIIVPVYNAYEHIDGFLKCASKQILSNFEIIFIDDGSDDDSYKSLSLAMEEDTRIKVQRISHRGPGIARNIGIKKATGRYVAFWDIDDDFNSDYLSKMVSVADEHNADVCVCAFREHSDRLNKTYSNMVFMDKNRLPNRRCVEPKEINKDIFRMFGNNVWNKIFRREYILNKQIEFPDTSYNEDMAFSYPALGAAERIAYTHCELMTYKKDAGESICDDRERFWSDNIESINASKTALTRLNIYECFEEAFLKEVTRMFGWYFKIYTNSEAFDGLYDFVQEKMRSRLLMLEPEDFDDFVEYQRWKMLIESKSSLDFALKQRGLHSDYISPREYKINRFPFEIISKETLVALYGAGDVGRDMFIQIVMSGYGKLAVWVDSYEQKYQYRGYPVKKKEALLETQWDIVIICVLNKKTAEDIIADLEGLGIDRGRIYAWVPEYDIDGLAINS